MTQRPWLKQVVAITLAFAMVLVLTFNIPTLSQFQEFSVYFLLYSLLTVIAMVYSILLSRGSIGIAHAVGIIAFLSLPHRALPVILWGIFIGGAVGGWVVMLRRRERVLRYRAVRRTLRNLLVTSSRVTLSFFVAAQLYILSGGLPPLRVGNSGDVAGLFLYSVGYIAVYIAIYIMEWYLEEQNVGRILRDNWKVIFYALTIPVAYAIPTAVIYTELPIEFFTIAIIGFGITILVTSAYSQDQYLLRQQLNEMSSLSVLSRELQANTDTTTLIKQMQRHLLQIMEADSVLVAVVDYETQQTRFPLYEEQSKTPRPADIALINNVIDSRLFALIEQNVNTYLQERKMPVYDDQIESVIGIPMMVRAKIVGAILLQSTGERRFRNRDMSLLEIIASAFSTSLDNAQLYQQQQTRVERLNTLNSISVLLSSTLSIESVMETITTSAAMLAESKAVAVYLSDYETDLQWVQLESPFNIQSSAGLPDHILNAGIPSLLQSSLSQSTKRPATNPTDITEFQPVIVQNVQHDERLRDTRQMLIDEDIRSLIELPLASNGQLFGVVVVYFAFVQSPNAEFIEFLRTFAGESAQAIKNAQLYTRTDEALEQRLFQLSILATVGQQTNASVDLEGIGGVVLELVTGYTHAERGAIVLYGKDQLEPKVTAKYLPADRSIDDRHIISITNTDRILSSKAYTGVAHHENGKVSLALVDDAQSQLIVPIIREGKSIGALVLESQRLDAFPKDDINFIVQLLDQASIAIDNRLLFQTVVQSSERLQVILDAMAEAIVMINDKGEVVLANPAVRSLGLEQQQLMNKNFRDLAAVEQVATRVGITSVTDVDDLMVAFSEQAAPDIPSLNFTIQHAHQAQFIERQVIPIHDENQKILGLLLVFYDHTKQMQLENTRDEFTRMIVHDLRSPLTAVTTSLYLIRKLVPDELEQHQQIAGITRSSEQAIWKMLQRVDSLLDIAKMESGELKLERDVIAFPDVVNGVFSELQPLAAEQNVTLKLNHSDNLPLLNGDIDKVERVMQNLVDNALKYTQNGTSIIVQTQPYQDDSTFAQINVVDHGPGIPQQDRERLFNRFVQLDNGRANRRGVGLGLTFCRIVVEAHGGRIWVEDNPSGGSIFSFTLPTLPQHEQSKS